MKNKLKQILASKRPAIGTWVAIPDVYAVEMIAGLGFDWLLVDMEHIPISKESLRAILLAVKGAIVFLLFVSPLLRLRTFSLPSIWEPRE